MPPSRTVADKAGQDPANIDLAFRDIQTQITDQLFPTGANPHAQLAIATTTTKVKTTNAIYGVINGVPFLKANTDNLWTLSGTVTNAKWNIFCLTLKADGTANAYMGVEASTLAGVTWPTIPQGEIMVGFVVINPSGTGSFVGGTTALNDGTVIPAAVYVNTMGDFNPNNLTLPNTITQ